MQRLGRLACLVSALAILPLAHADTQTYRYEPDTSVFPNPERGFYLYQSLDRLDNAVDTMRDQRGMTLLWGKISLDDYRETPELPAELLERLQRGFDRAQQAGAKVIVRVKYGFTGPDGTYRTYEDPSIEIIEGHIRQLAPLFAANADRIAFFEAGFIGPWGEWHGTRIAREPTLQRRVFFHLLDHTPTDRMIVLRYPALKQSIFRTRTPLTAAQAYDGSHIARAAHHNDCFLSSENDVGTYNRGGQTMAQEMAYLAAETRYTLFGGETCRLHDRSLRDNALHELEMLHASYLNSGYHPDVLQRWREDGVMDILERRLGARIEVRSLTLPSIGTPGATTRVRIELINTGFASLYNPRPVHLVLQGPDETRHTFVVNADPRHWKPGEPVVLTSAINLPADLPSGDYNWSLHLPDASPRLADDPRFAYRLATHGAWDDQTGENRLLTGWQVQSLSDPLRRRAPFGRR